MREITKYHDTSKTVKERAKTKVFGAVYSHTAIILSADSSSDWYYGSHFYISGKLQYLYERSDIASFFYHSDLYFQ